MGSRAYGFGRGAAAQAMDSTFRVDSHRGCIAKNKGTSPMSVATVQLDDFNLSYSDFVHTDPGTLAGRFMRMFWHPIYRSQDLAIGRAVPVKIMGEDFTLYRGESGAAHLLAYRCAHRGTQLSVGRVEGDCIRCF